MRLLTNSLSLGALALILVVAFAVPAFGAGYLSWTAVSGLPGNAGSTSPHGGYGLATVKCQVCHAVHQAGPGQLLLNTTVDQACIYCHVNTLSAYTQVYNSNPSNYSGADYPNAHNSVIVNGTQVGVTCEACHQVHAAATMMTNNAYLTTMLLKGPKAYSPFPQPNADPDLGVPLSTDDSVTALTKWCMCCHINAQTGAGEKFQGYTFWTNQYATGQGLPGMTTSHVATLAHSSYANMTATTTTRVAWQSSANCSDCHSSGFNTPNWPHYTSGVRFLESAPTSGVARSAAATVVIDGICLQCHVAPGNAGGVGVTF